MKSSINFKIANVSSSMLEAVIGEISVSAEVEYTPEEFLALVSQAGEFYAWLGGKIDPIIEAGIPLVIEAMRRDAAEVRAEKVAGDFDGDSPF